jgi:hypothetical protein
VIQFRPGASVRPVPDGAVLARAGRSVAVRGRPEWEAVARVLSTAPGAVASAPAPVRLLLAREGMTTSRTVTGVDAPIAARAASDSWLSIVDARWRITGPPALSSLAEEALTCWVPGALLDTTTARTAGRTPADDGALTVAVRVGSRLPSISVAPDGAGWAVLETAAMPLWRAWRQRMPAPEEPGEEHPRDRGTRSARDATIAVGAGFAMLQSCLAGAHDATGWMRVRGGESRGRSLPPLAPTVRTIRALEIADPRPESGDVGRSIDALADGADEEFGWWTRPHPGDLPQLPLAQAESWVRHGPETRVVGIAPAHDGAWAEAALGVARVVAGGAAGFGTLAACADVFRAVAEMTDPGRPGERPPAGNRADARGVADRGQLGMEIALRPFADTVGRVRAGRAGSAAVLIEAVGRACGVTVQPVSIGPEWDAAGIVTLRITAGSGSAIDDLRRASEGGAP